MTELYVIAAALPPQLDGIGDYTAHFAAEIAKSMTVTVLTGGGAVHAPVPGATVKQAFSADRPPSVWRIAKELETNRPGWALLQYNPFSYGRWGLNLHLPRVMRWIKRRRPDMKFALMVHEPFVPIINAKFAVMATWQRWQLRHLGLSADIIFFSIDPWVQRFRSWFPGKPVLHLPVSSNIPHVPCSRQEARARLGIADETIVLGLFGTAHTARLLERARSAAQAVRQSGRDLRVLYIGPHGSAVCAALESVSVITDGALPADEVSRRFAAMDVYLVPLIDGVSTRRTSLMTALQHGVATVGTRGPLTDDMLARQDGRAFLLADVGAPAGFNAHVMRLVDDVPFRERVARDGQRLYHSEFTWPRIAGRFLTDLQEV